MIVVYTQKITNAIKMAASLGGVPFRGTIIQANEINSVLDDIIEECSSLGYIESSIEDKNALFTWGENLLIRCSLEEYEEEILLKIKNNEAFIPNEISYRAAEGKSREVDVLKGLFAAEKHDTLYDASIGNEDSDTFRMICELADASEKIIRRIELKNLSAAGIREAFKTPLDVNLTKARMIAGKIKDYIDFVGDTNIQLAMSSILPETSSISLSSIPLLRIMDEKAQAASKNSKVSYAIKGHFDINDTNIVLSSADASFMSQKKARAFFDTLPASAEITKIEESIVEEYPPGPHSLTSLTKTVQTIFGYSQEQLREILSSLYAGGYITDPNTNCRLYEEGSEEKIHTIMKKLSKVSRYVKVLENVDSMKAADFIYKGQGEAGIIASGKMPSKTMTQEERNVFIVICNEMVKTYYPPKKLKETKILIDINDVIFEAKSYSLLDKGYTILQQNVAMPVDYLAGLHEGQIIEIRFTIDAETEETMSPATETDLIHSLSDNRAYTPEMIRHNADYLVNNLLAESQDGKFYPSSTGKIVINILSLQPALISGDAMEEWELKLKEIRECRNLDDAINLSSSMIAEFKKTITTWKENIEAEAGKESHLTCPSCYDMLHQTPSRFYCRTCGWNTDRIINGRFFTEKEMYILLTSRTTPVIAGFQKRDRDIRGRVYLTDKNEVRFTEYSIHSCPACKGKLKVNRTGNKYFCPDKECGFTLQFQYFGHDLTRDEITKLITENRTQVIDDFKTANGTFKGCLLIDSTDGFKIKCIQIN